MLIFIYIAAIVTCDLLVTHYGPAALPFTAFFLIPLDLVIKDVLQDKWRSAGVQKTRMAALILSGSVISYLLNKDSKNIAIGSFAAFCVSGTLSYFVYEIFKHKPRLKKMAIANCVAAFFDSSVFQLVAFGAIVPYVFAAQFLLKFFGGLAWAALFSKYMERKHEDRSC